MPLLISWGPPLAIRRIELPDALLDALLDPLPDALPGEQAKKHCQEP